MFDNFEHNMHWCPKGMEVQKKISIVMIRQEDLYCRINNVLDQLKKASHHRNILSQLFLSRYLEIASQEDQADGCEHFNGEITKILKIRMNSLEKNGLCLLTLSITCTGFSEGNGGRKKRQI